MRERSREHDYSVDFVGIGNIKVRFKSCERVFKAQLRVREKLLGSREERRRFGDQEGSRSKLNLLEVSNNDGEEIRLGEVRLVKSVNDKAL